MKKPNYYSLKSLLKCNADTNIIYGARMNGKSYAVKNFCVSNFFKTGGKFAYIRRNTIDIKTTKVESYFSNSNVFKYSKEKYNGIMCYRERLYPYTYTEDGKTIRGLECGAYFCLSTATHYKSLVYEGYTDIIFEEFIAEDNIYIDNEPNVLLNVISTIARNNPVRVWLIGNTISRFCPYIREWGLKGMYTQKQGTIELYNMADVAGVSVLAVERTVPIDCVNRNIFGNAKKSIINGDWDQKEYPHLWKDYKYFEKMYEVLVEYGDLSYVCQLLFDTVEDLFTLYVYPFNNNRVINRVLTDKYNRNLDYTHYFNMEVTVEKLMHKLIINNKVVFSDNLTGEEFYLIIKKLQHM